MQNLKNKRAGWAVLLIIASAAVAATVLVGTGAAAKSNLTYVNVGAAAFVPQNSNPLCVYTRTGYSGKLVDQFDDCEFVAHIDLPDGMKIGSITAYYNNAYANGRFRFEANDDLGNHDDLVTDFLDGSAGDEGGAVCDGSDNCSAIWDLNEKVNNNTTHYGIWFEALDDDFVVYRFKIKLKQG